MAFDGIDVFVEVVNAQSFSQAARRLGMPTTTVSAKIARLEKRLGITLLHRTTRKLSVTEAGQRYYRSCKQALDALQAGEQALAQSAGQPAGTLRLTAPPDLANSLLPPVIERYLDHYPQVNVDLSVTNRHMDLIADGIDLAVRVGKLETSSLIIRKFVSGQISLWASPAYLKRHGTPRHPDDLKAHRFIQLVPAGPQITLIGQDGASADVDISGRLACDDIQTTQTYAERGIGIAMLPDFFLSASTETGSLVPVLPEFGSAQMSVYFVYPSQTFVPPTVKAFMATALELKKSPAASAAGP